MTTAIQILRPKLRPPRLGARLERPRLFAELDSGLLGHFTLVAAPAGYGKTTLLAQWIQHQDTPAAWLSLDESDNDPALFLEELVAAVTTVWPDSCRGIRSLLARSGLPPLELLTQQLANDLDDLDEFILVLDDCQYLNDPGILGILQSLIFKPPGPMHLVLCCRADPMLPLGSLRGRGLVREVRASDLRFSDGEALAYLEQALGQQLAEDQIRRLVDRTEGWIAGLHLAALSILRREDMPESIRNFAGSDRNVADYLMEELFVRLDPTVQRYLTVTSILTRLCAPLCQAVMADVTLDVVEGRPVLEWLEESNLFVVSLDERREWYRYHHLFRDMLRHRLEATWPKEDVAGLHIRAGDWYADEHRVDDALDHFLKGRRPDLAASVIEMHRREAIDQERWRSLERWVRKLGADVVDTRPRLVLIYGWLAHRRLDFENMARHSDRAERLLDAQEPTPGDEDILRGEIATIRAVVTYWRGEADTTLLHARSALALLPPDYAVARATATVMHGGALQLLGQTQKAFEVLNSGSSGEYGRGIHPRVMTGLALVGFMTGDVEHAGRVGDMLLSQATERGLQESTGWAHYFAGLAAYLRNDLPAAEDHYEAVEPYSAHGIPGLQSLYGQAWVRQAQGRPEEALEVMDRCLSFVSNLNLPLVPEVRLLRARLAALSGRPSHEVALARSFLPPVGDPVPAMHVCYEHSEINAAAILVLEGTEDDLTGCQDALAQLLAAAEANHNTFRSIQCLILQALLFDRQDRNLEGLAPLDRAVALARHGRILRLFPDMGDHVATLLHALHLRGPADPFVDELLATFAAPMPPSVDPAPGSDLDAGRQCLLDCLLTNRELDVLELLDQRLSNKEIAQLLFIAPSTVKRHTLSIYSKLGANSRREAVVRAHELGFLHTDR